MVLGQYMAILTGNTGLVLLGIRWYRVSIRDLMPVYIEKSGNLVECYQCLTDSFCFSIVRSMLYFK